ncbi:hypothetical protein [Halolamina salina]|uniref:DUF2795 domain-containing protein n=1 Tax=Halolamina salina TaxID=1220023 RepID=A0ABD6B4T7_9EURY
MSDDVPPDEQAERRQRDRRERQEEILSEFESAVDDVKFPSNSAEIRAELRDAPDEVVAEEESLGSVLDRLDDEFEDEQAARDAIMEELGEAEHADPATTEREEIAETERETTGVVDEIDEDEA